MTPHIISQLKSESRKTARTPTAKVAITWAGSAVDNAHAYTLPNQPVNRASIAQQTIMAIGNQRRWAFCETDNPSESIARLDEDICVMPDFAEHGLDADGFLVGWWGSNAMLSGADGQFTEPQVLQISFAPTTIGGFRLHGYLDGDAEYSEWPVDFDVTAMYWDGRNYIPCRYSDGTLAIIQMRGNTTVNASGRFMEPVTNVEMLEFAIMSWNRRGAFVKITAAYDNFTREHSSDDIMEISILEEAEGSVGVLPIGNISCNELNLTLQNIDDHLSIGNPLSELSGLARSNRRIEPYIGFRLTDENGNYTTTEYAPKGVYWSRDWNISLQGTSASTSALDRLGLLQEVEYNGIGNVNNHDAVSEASMWVGMNLYTIAEDVLHDLRLSYMTDLEFAIDEALKDITIPLAFFKQQSYFDVIKTIAQAATAYAYMDTPTETELTAAHARGNRMCADILRIRKLEHLYPVDGDVVSHEILAHTEEVTLDDIIAQTIQARRADMVNVVVVPWEAYELVNGTPKPPDDSDTQYVTVANERAIREYGRLEYEYSENNLIQTESQARAIAEGILKAFSGTQRHGEISTFGDVTCRIGDIWNVPEYQKRGIDNRGIYVVTRLSTDYDGSLRQAVTCRRIGDVPPPLPPTVTLSITAISASRVRIQEFTVIINGISYTTDTGVVNIPDLPPGDHDVTITSTWYVSQTVTISANYDTDYEFVLEPVTVIVETGGADTTITETGDAPIIIVRRTDHWYMDADHDAGQYYIIDSIELVELAEIVNGNFVYKGEPVPLDAFGGKTITLTGDIDLGVHSNWMPIGIDSTIAFMGTFNADGYLIRNLKIDRAADNQGLFGYMLGGRVLRLGLVDVNVSADTNVGGICGNMGKSEISDCYVTGNVGGSRGSVGSIAGLFSAAGGVGSLVRRCYAFGEITSNGAPQGGLVGVSQGQTADGLNGSLIDCAALHSRVGGSSFAGRVVGRPMNGGQPDNNVAFDGMLNSIGTTAWSSKGPRTQNGEDITIAEINANGTLGGRFTSANGWTVEHGKLPGLRGRAVDMPQHLQM